MRILFDFLQPYFLTGYYTVLHELKRRGIEVAVSPMQERLDPRFREFVVEHCPGVRLLPSAAAVEGRWDLILVAGALYERAYQDGQPVGRLHHGGCIGNSRSLYPLDSFRAHRMDVFFGLSQRDIDLGAVRHPGMWEGKITKIIGWPKLDRLMRNPRERAARLGELGLKPEKQTVVFTSHWTENSLIRTIGLNVIAALGLLREYNVIVTAHPLVFTDVRKAMGGNPEAVLGTLCRGRAHMRFLPVVDSAEVIPLGDVFLADYSSITYELAALNRPVLWYCDPLHDFSDPVLKEKTVAATYPFQRVQELRNLLAWATAHAKEKESERGELAEYVYAFPGQATDACVRAIIEAVDELRSRGHPHYRTA